MDEIKYSIRISPEVLKSDISVQTYSGDSGTDTFGVYSNLPYVLSGNTGGSSFLTGLTIPIVFTQTINDIGIYSPFDGDILQKDIISNFLYSASTTNPYDVKLYNTSGDITISFLNFSNFYVNWGDNQQVYQIQNQPINHVYPATPSAYTITFSGVNNWGTTIVKKQIHLPATGVTVTNTEGSVTFIPQSGNWSGIPTTYDFIFTGDSENNLQSQISSSYVQVPFPVSGFTKSRLRQLKKYGPNPYVPGYVFTNILGQPIGQIDSVNTDYTAYTINSIQYYDLPDKKTLFIASSSGLTQDNIVVSALTKNETFLDFVMDPEIQNGVFIERGKYSAFEGLQRLGEVDNIGDLERYGYNYFKINSV